MKVLHLLGTAEDNGGILSTLRGLAEASGSSGWQHHVWVNAAFQETREPALDYRRSRHGLDESKHHFLLAWRAWRSFGELRWLLHAEPFDVIHAHTRGGFLMARLVRRLLHRPVAFTNHAYARRTGMYRRAARLPGMFTVLLTPRMSRHYEIDLAHPSVRCISECCRDSFFAAALAVRRPFQPEGTLNLVGLGNLVRWKKWDLVLRAMRELPAELRRRVHFTLWGPTPRDADAQLFARELAQLANAPELIDRVSLAGLTDKPTAALKSADWFVLPSTNEPCSVAVIEALASGLPVLASASGGNPDLIHEGRTGLLFEPDNVGSLLDCLVRILEGRVTPESPGRIRDIVRWRSASAVAAEHGQLYRDLCKS